MSRRHEDDVEATSKREPKLTNPPHLGTLSPTTLDVREFAHIQCAVLYTTAEGVRVSLSLRHVYPPRSPCSPVRLPPSLFAPDSAHRFALTNHLLLSLTNPIRFALFDQTQSHR